VGGEPRPSVRAKKRQRDRLIALAQAHPAWAWGFEDETWWSRLPQASPALSAWAAVGEPLRLVGQAVARDDLDPKALACYGLLVRQADAPERFWLRFVDGRPVSAATIEFLRWSCGKLDAAGVPVLVLVWDNAGWHVSHEARDWIRAHNREVKRRGRGVRLLACYLPAQSPWLNPVEPKWVHGKRRVAEPDGLLSAAALEARAYSAYGCSPEPHLTIAEQVA
jgi:DDE superfamily endonuclease